MKQIKIILTILAFMTIAFGQKFMVNDNDTLFYHEKMEVFNGDTTYLGNCHTFEKIKGQIINQSDNNCLRQGLWKITDSLGNYSSGNYLDNNKIGVWKQFNKSGKLIKETEEVSFGKDTYKVKEIDYTGGKPKIIIDKPFLSFYIKNLIAIMIIFFLTFFGRIFVNSSIYNTENNTVFSIINFNPNSIVSKKLEHNLLCTFTFWFFNYKPENRLLVIISNTMSIITLTIFFGIIIGLIVTGEI